MDTAQGERATLLIAASKYDAAMEIIAASLANDPDDGDAWALRSQVHMARNEAPQALTSINRAIAAAPEDALAYGAKAAVSMQLGEFGQALDAARRGVGLDPEDAWLQGVFALALGMGTLQGLYGCTRERVWRAVWRVQELDDMSNPIVPVYAATALLLVNTRGPAVKILKRAVARHPNSAELVAALGMCRNPQFGDADAWQLMGSANALNSQAVMLTRGNIIVRAVQMAMQYQVVGGELLALAGVWMYLETYAGWSPTARLVTGSITTVTLLPSLVSHIRMPAPTRGFLRDNVRYYGLVLWGGVLTVLAGLVAVFGPRPWALPAIVAGFVTAAACGWAAGKVRDSFEQSMPTTMLTVASFRKQRMMFIVTFAVAVVIIVLRLLGADTIRISLGVLVFAPLLAAVLRWLVHPRSAVRTSYPGKLLMQVAVGLGAAVLPVMAWGQAPLWPQISVGVLLAALVLWWLGLKRSAAAGSSWRASISGSGGMP
jgi:tetratricopeptide repeat protein